MSDDLDLEKLVEEVAHLSELVQAAIERLDGHDDEFGDLLDEFVRFQKSVREFQDLSSKDRRELRVLMQETSVRLGGFESRMISIESKLEPIVGIRDNVQWLAGVVKGTVYFVLSAAAVTGAVLFFASL